MRASLWSIFCAVVLSALTLTLNGCGRSAQAEREIERAAKPGRIVPELAGKWRKKQADPRAEYTRYAENLGRFETLEIDQGGGVRRETLDAGKIYDCPVEDVSASEGAIVVESDTRLNITFDTGTRRHRDACSPANDFVAPIKPTTDDFRWKIARTGNGASELCLTAASGETACYLRVE